MSSPWRPSKPLAELFRHRFIAALFDKKIISERKARQLLNWKHSGFSLDAGDKPVHSAAGVSLFACLPAHGTTRKRSQFIFRILTPVSNEQIHFHPRKTTQRERGQEFSHSAIHEGAA
jgi:hypothetical protein